MNDNRFGLPRHMQRFCSVCRKLSTGDQTLNLLDAIDLARMPEAMVLRVVSHGLYQRQENLGIECLEILLVFPRAIGTTRALHEVNIRVISEPKLFGLHRNKDDYCVGATQWSRYEVTGLFALGRRLVFVHRSGGGDSDSSIGLPIAHILHEG